MEKILIASLHFSPAFIGHMEAWYQLCIECGYEPLLFIEEQYIKYFKNTQYKFVTDLSSVENFKPDFAVIQNNWIDNIQFFKWCSKNNCKILYIVHEPYMGFKELMKEGSYLWKQAVACIINLYLCKKSTKLIICSDYAEKNCKRYMKNVYAKVVRMPLLFLDDDISMNNGKRKYCSLIGTYAHSRGSDLFLKFIKESYKRKYDIYFQIATRSNIEKELQDDIFQELIKEGKLVVQQGRTLSNEEINNAYKRSICTWNGYRRSTQSGVLPNAFMMGTPVLATDIGSFKEFVKPGITGEFINNEDTDSIYNSYIKIYKNIDNYTIGCRKEFLNNNYYKSQINTFKEIIKNINKEKSN